MSLSQHESLPIEQRPRSRLLVAVPLLLVLLVFLVFWPLAAAARDAAAGRFNAYLVCDMPVAERLQTLLIDLLTALWFFFLGGTLGSFINVAVWRMPRGESVIWHGSACPRCHSPIRARHNLPVVGWLILGGRCYDCRLPISIRYPLVELLMATVVVGLLNVELLSGGANLPLWMPYQYTGATWILWSTKWGLVSKYAYHVLCFGFLLPWALMLGDGIRPPLRFYMVAFGTMLSVPLIVPYFLPENVPLGQRSLHPVPWSGPSVGLPDLLPAWPNSLSLLAYGEAVWAGLAGGLLFAAFGRGVQGANPRGQSASYIAAAGLVGAVFGWQTALSICAFASLLQWVIDLLACRIRYLRCFPQVGSLFVAALGHLVLWRLLDQTHFWSAARVHWQGLTAAATTLLAANLLLRALPVSPIPPPVAENAMQSDPSERI